LDDSLIEFAARLEELSQHPNTETEIALTVSQVIDLRVNRDETRNQLSALLADIVTIDSPDVQQLLEGLSKAGFGTAGGRQVIGTQHSNLQWVIARRSGIPISLAVIIIEAARRMGMVAHGINYPGHFLVRVDNQLIDPLRMQVVDPSSLTDPLESTKIATPRILGLRMLNNLKGLSLRQHDWSRALELVDLQFALAGSHVETCSTLHYEQGEFWQQLGAYTSARDAYLKCAQNCSIDSLKVKAEEKAAQMGKRHEVVH